MIIPILLLWKLRLNEFKKFVQVPTVNGKALIGTQLSLTPKSVLFIITGVR